MVLSGVKATRVAGCGTLCRASARLVSSLSAHTDEVAYELIVMMPQLLSSACAYSPRDVLMQRLTGRLTCRSCGRTFHREFNPPAVEGICDFDGGELFTRSDDTEEAVSRRLEIYFAQTKPLLARWRELGLVRDVDGNADIAHVTQNVENALAQDFNETGAP